MNKYIEIIGQLKPKNGRNFPIADVNDFIGGYIQVDEVSDMEKFPSSKIKEGMLCYVKNTSKNGHMYQFSNGAWSIWTSGSGGGLSIEIVDSLEDLNNPDLQIKGQIVFVNEVNELRYYTGYSWESFSRIYIQSTPPDDTGGIWIDTSENKEHLSSNTVIQNLLKVVNILQEKVKRLEYALDCQMDSGDFTNNQYNYYNGAESEEPNYGSSEEEDNAEQEANKDFVLGDSPEPTEYNDYIPNLKHLCIKAGTYADMIKNQEDFLPK